MCDELIYCTCETHDLAVEDERKKNPDFSEPVIRKAYLVRYNGKKLSLRPVCELCENVERDKGLMDLEMAIKHRDLSRGYRPKPRLAISDSDLASPE
ncbi:MAG: hypothetical protein PHW53_01710 [Patescibacteria group bacterium]|nr:hypothetical protein [Patescibacteria group bacterium]